MATPTDIALLRQKIQESANEEPYTDDYLSALIDAYGMDPAAGQIWEIKAAAVARLVDISEGGSSRKMSQVFSNYTALAAQYNGKGSVEDPSGYTAPRARKITRV